MENEKTISLSDWLITLLITAIPFVGLIMLFIWAFGGNTPASKANWAKANLIFAAIAIVLAIIFWSMIAAAFMGSAGYR